MFAKRHDGGLAAIQCKCQDRIDKHHIDSFLSESQRRLMGEPYVERYIFTTATEWSYNAERAISRIDPPVQRVDFFGLDGAAVEWDALLQDETASLSIQPRKRLRPHQVSALNDVIAGFETHDRGKLIMACGTGKTLTALRIAEQIAGLGGRVFVRGPLALSACPVNAGVGLGCRESPSRLRGLLRYKGRKKRWR